MALSNAHRAAAFSWLALAPACGTLDGAPHMEPAPADGVSGFVDQGPIALCIGLARAVSPSPARTVPLGVCSPAEGTGPTSCVRDGDCALPESCVCGHCMVRACRDSSDCEDGASCQSGTCLTTCLSDADCASGAPCTLGVCGVACKTDDTCGFGGRCDGLSGICRAAVCTADASGGARCPIGLVCTAEELFAEAREPTLVSGDDTSSVAYLELRTPLPAGGAGFTASIYRARVDSSKQWTVDPVDPVIDPDPALDDGSVGAPAAVRRGDVVDLYFATGAGAIAHAVSDDGMHFVRDGAPFFAAADPWEAGRVGSPSVFAFLGETYLLYEGGAGIGIARVKAGLAERFRADPWIRPETLVDPLFFRAVDAVGSPDAVVVGDTLRVYLTAHGIEDGASVAEGVPRPEAANDSIGLVATRDLADLAPFVTGPVFARRSGVIGYLGEREPAVVVSDDPRAPRFLVYVGSDENGGSTTGLNFAADR